ncbi:tumor necrosis factor ligand superfamily member 14 [Sebastes umbrosus]|uniref:tumor necrosis factor ligand superfamily member 14 n=1 Tax=Sebastes umbrosus TaxID=72105 RepID=UPI00189CEF6C|nr:tumor necrosis factor ligand superfamily member 14 [Sebastes umbrosus]
MSKGGYPSVFMVDTHATRPPVPPRLSQGQRRPGAAQTLLIMLVCVALCGLAIEACFIYRLYHLEPDTQTSHSNQIAGQDFTSSTKSPSPSSLPDKPVAHLTGGQDVVHGDKIMAWSMIADPLLFEMGYKDKSIVIQKDGFYHVYSKVSFLDTGGFVHSVNRKTKLYLGKSFPLLMSKKYSKKSREMRSNSYLGGVFHLRKDDALFVEVSNTSNIVQQKSFENIFGAFMI